MIRLLTASLPPLLAIVCVAAVSAVEPPKTPPKAVFIDNGKVRLGVDLASGGSVFYLSASKPHRNLLNHYDRGRFVQQSYYGDADGSKWVNKPWRWNPVQGRCRCVTSHGHPRCRTNAAAGV